MKRKLRRLFRTVRKKFVNYYYRAVWTTFPKKCLRIKDIDVTYVHLPRWLAIRGANEKVGVPSNASLLYGPSDVPMIFIKGNITEQELRYGLYHEHCEVAVMQRLVRGQKNGQLDTVMRATLAELKDCMATLQNYRQDYAEQIISARKAGQSFQHLYALSKELVLAESEMDRDKFVEYLDYALTYRL